MRRDPELRKALKQPTAQVYLFVCLFSLAVVLMVQMLKDNVMLNAFIFIVGILGLIARFQSAPVVMLIILSIGEFLHGEFVFHYWRRRGTMTEFNLADAVQCMALLGYMICQYRLFAMTANVFPRDPRLREIPKDRKKMPYKRREVLSYQRSDRGLSPVELALVFLSVTVFGVLAQVAWNWLSLRRSVFGLSRLHSQYLIICWIAFLALVFVAVILRIRRWYSISPEQAKLYLQDTFWKETRREQRRQYRFLVWRRLYEQQRKART